MTGAGFIPRERLAQAAYFARTLPADVVRPEAPYRLKPEHRPLNLAPQIRTTAPRYFGPPLNIAWHLHAGHALSSQVCCVNFMQPLATQPELLASVVGAAMGIAPPRMLPVEDGPDGEPWFVGLEWIGREDHLGEWPKTGNPQRGANVTSADAVVQFAHEGSKHTLLIEWKYSESYGAPPAGKSREERIRRYKDKAFAPAGPLKPDLGLSVEDLFWEPVYQMFRQQMLAWRMQGAREDGADRVSVLHISPRANAALHTVTAPALQPFGDDAFTVFKSLLVRSDDFLSVSTEDLFGPLVTADHADPQAQGWADYLRDRYSFLF